MGNLKNYNFNKTDAFLSNSAYYDFYLAQDGYATHTMYNGIITDCLIAHFDFNDSATYGSGPTSADTIYSLTTWVGATNTGYTFQTFGLTGIDNGYITYLDEPENFLLQEDNGMILLENGQSLLESDDGYNGTLLSALTGTTIVITSGDTRLTLNRVTGMTGNYIYPLEYYLDLEIEENYMGFCGGFYQGYYKLDGYSYEVLPTRVPKAWVAEFILKKDDSICPSGYTGTTLNDTYPDNKGFFFYMGTRAENKYWNIFEGNNTGCTSGCTVDSGCTGTVTTYCTVPKETQIAISGDSGYPIRLSPPPLTINEITNPFLIYGRASKDNNCGACGAPSGLGNETAYSFTGDSVTIATITQEVTNTQNPFLIYGRANKDNKCGSCGAPSGLGNESVCSFSGFTSPLIELDRDADIIDNAIGFRIKDDGSIGYRALKLTGYCIDDVYTTGVTVEEQYSEAGVITDGEWEQVAIRFVMPEYDECELKNGKPRKGKLMFYVGCLLKFAVEEVDEFIARRLNEYKDKQLGVPFNISLGGGSQGLLESMTFDGQDPDDLGLTIQENFAGTFIGGISQFRFYDCDLNWCDLKNNCANDCERYDTCTGCRPVDVDGDILNEDGTLLLQENGFKILQQ